MNHSETSFKLYNTCSLQLAHLSGTEIQTHHRRQTFKLVLDFVFALIYVTGNCFDLDLAKLAHRETTVR